MEYIFKTSASDVVPCAIEFLGVTMSRFSRVALLVRTFVNGDSNRNSLLYIRMILLLFADDDNNESLERSFRKSVRCTLVKQRPNRKSCVCVCEWACMCGKHMDMWIKADSYCCAGKRLYDFVMCERQMAAGFCYYLKCACFVLCKKNG